MKHYIFEKSPSGMDKYFKTIPKIRSVIRSYLDCECEEFKEGMREEYNEANNIYKNFIVFKSFLRNEFHEYIDSRMHHHVPKVHINADELFTPAGFDLQKQKACQEVFDGLHKVGLVTKKYDFYKVFSHLDNDKWKKYISKRLLPDDVFVNLSTKTVFIIEKKYQMGAGSVDEKLQTVDFKIKEYKKMLPDWDVKFFYILNDFFKQDVYRDVFNYIKSVGGDYYFNTLPLEDLGLDCDD